MKHVWILLVAVQGAIMAQPALPDPVTLGTVTAPASVQPGQTFEAIVPLEIDPPYHVYGLKKVGVEVPTSLAVSGAGLKLAGDPRPDRPSELKPGEFGYRYWKEKVTFRVPIQVAKDQKPGSLSFKVTVNYMACTDTACLNPTAATGNATVTVAAAGTKESKKPEISLLPGSTFGAGLGGFEADDQDPVYLERVSGPAEVAGGSIMKVEVKVSIEPPYHIYGLSSPGGTPTEFAVSGSDRVEIAGEATASRAPKVKKDKYQHYTYWEEHVIFEVPVRVKGKEAQEELSFNLTMDYMACTMQGCLPKRSLSEEVVVEVVEGKEGDQSQAPAETANPSGSGEKAPPSGSGEPGPGATPSGANGDVVATLEPATLAAGDTATLTIPLPKGAVQPGEAGLKIVLLDSPVELAGDVEAIERDGALFARVPVEVRRNQVQDEEFSFTGIVRRESGPQLAGFSVGGAIANPLLGFLVLAALSALLALLTPCVFPMIPITVSFFTKQAEASSKSPVSMGLLYGFGIVASFTAMGVLFTFFVGGAGASNFALHGITQALIGILFLVFAFSLFGAFELQLPASFQNLVGRAQGKGGGLGVLLLGLLFAVTTFTCTAPFVGGILAGAATSGDYLRPALAMFVFSAVLAIPFVFLSIFPSRLKSLPKSGGWLNEVKVCMGFIEVAAAFKFLGGMDQYYGWNVFTRSFVICSWAVCFIAMGIYLLGLFRLPHDSPKEKVGVLAMCFALLSAGFGLYVLRGLDGSPLHEQVDAYMPRELASRRQEVRDRRLVEQIRKAVGSGAGAAVAKTARPEGRWGLDAHFRNKYEDARAEAKRLGAALFINFTANG